MRPFRLGRIVATPAALAALEAAGGQVVSARLLRRHLTGDWGELDAEADRSTTTLLLPSDY